MSLDILNEVEKKIDAVVDKIQVFESEKSSLSSTIEDQGVTITQLKNDNRNLKSKLDSLTVELREKTRKIDTTAERIQGLLTKLESFA